MEEVLAFSQRFFFGMVAALHLEELDHLAPRDMIHLIQDLD
jgi:hypothetical protein